MSGKEILRNQKRRLEIIRHAEEITKNIAKTRWYFGLERATFYPWFERYRKYWVEGLRD